LKAVICITILFVEYDLIKLLSKYIPISDELAKAITDLSFIRQFPRGTVLLKEGDKCNECFFVLKGLIRSYCLQDGDEITTDFYLEEQVASPACFGTETPSDLYLECLEDTVACVGTPQMETEMFARYPELETMSRIMGEKIMADYQNSLGSFRTASPEQRYLNLIKNNSELLQRVPQYQLAGYLGIKPESLSRIRKRISKSNNS